MLRLPRLRLAVAAVMVISRGPLRDRSVDLALLQTRHSMRTYIICFDATRICFNCLARMGSTQVLWNCMTCSFRLFRLVDFLLPATSTSLTFLLFGTVQRILVEPPVLKYSRSHRPTRPPPTILVTTTTTTT